MPGVNPVGIGLFPPAAVAALAGSTAQNDRALANNVSGTFLFNAIYWEVGDAEIKALPGAATTVLRTLTPPAGYAAVPFKCFTETNTLGGGYAGPGSNPIGLRYRNTVSAGAYSAHPVAAMYTAGAARQFFADWDLSSTLNNGFISWAAPNTPLNSAIDLIATPSAVFTAGNAANYWRFWLAYMMVNLTGTLR